MLVQTLKYIARCENINTKRELVQVATFAKNKFKVHVRSYELMLVNRVSLCFAIYWYFFKKYTVLP